ncbi:hypothetical protein ACQZ6A_18120 [Agrobacterium vitis]
MRNYCIIIAVVSLGLFGKAACAQQLQVDVMPSAENFTGAGVNAAGGIGGIPMKVDVDKLSQSIVDLGGAYDSKVLAKSLKEIFDKPAFSPELNPTYGSGPVTGIGAIPSFEGYRPHRPYLTLTDPQNPLNESSLAIAAGNIGIINQTGSNFAFLITRADGSSKAISLFENELRTFECSTDCTKGFKVRYSSGDFTSVKEIEMIEKTLYQIIPNGAEWTIKQTTPSGWKISYNAQTP